MSTKKNKQGKHFFDYICIKKDSYLPPRHRGSQQRRELLTDTIIRGNETFIRKTDSVKPLKKMCAMKRLQIFLLTAAVAVVASGCTSAYFSSAGAYDDLYATHDVQAIAERQKAEAEVRKAEAEAAKAEAEALIAQRKAEAAEYEAKIAAINAALQADNSSIRVTSTTDGLLITDDNVPTLETSYVADTYESAYARRLKGFTSPSYRMPSSYFNLRYSSANSIVTAYDPALYNIMVSGDEVWVEPKYITSMFGTWGAINATIAFSSPWYYGWRSWGTYDPWYYRSFRSCWGFPRYSWWDWNWHMCYADPYYYRWTGSLGWWGWGGMYCPSYHWGWHHPQHHGYWTGHWGPLHTHYGWGGGWSPAAPRPHAPRLENGPNPKFDRGGSIYGSRNQNTGQGGRGNNNGAIVNRGSSHSTPYRSPSNGTTYGGGTRGQSATAAIQQQRAAQTARSSSVGRGSSGSTGRSSYSSSSSSSRSSISSSSSSSRSSSSSYSSGSSSSYSGGGGGGSVSSGGGSRGGGGGASGGGGGSRGR